jgi:AAA+ ATPase superfamily predicted ATPase
MTYEELMDFFPLTIARGKSFCNRKAELSYLLTNIVDSKPTLLISPRRYGKTSLALNAIHQAKLPFAHIDFLSAINETDIEKRILKGAGDILTQIETGVRKAIQLAKDLFSGLDIHVNFKKIGISLEVGQKSENPANNILTVLERIDYLCLKYRKKVVLFLDEFQRLCEITDNHAIESVMREVAQKSKNIMFIFSGSNRHLLHQMFDDRKRPFYKLCDRIILDRISGDEYRKYIQSAAKKTWPKILSEDVIQKIMSVTERHPYYVNLICSKLWKQKLPQVNDVDTLWKNYMMEERSQVANEIELLSKNQRKLLSVLSRSNGTDAPRSREFEKMAEMSGATIAQALDFLEKRDYIFRNETNRYIVLDPLIKAVLSGS